MTRQNNNDLFSKLGVEISDGKLNIDLNQTYDFFDALKNTFKSTAQNIQKDISEGRVDMSATVGIKIDKENIHINLKKTKSFIENFEKKIEGFLKEIENGVEDFVPKK